MSDNPTNNTKNCFAPIMAANCRVLILGSLPGDASLQQGHYYAHPRNAFWPIVSHILQLDLSSLPFEQRYAVLLQHGIALWDVIQSATRKGSLDSAISGIQANPLQALILSLPQLEHVIFNGQTAAKHGTRSIPGHIQQSIAPSSSPAYTLPYSIKLAHWQAIFGTHKDFASR